MALGKLGKVGNSLVVRIPAAMARELDLREGAELKITRHHRDIVIREASRMEAMLATVPDDYPKGEWDTGHAVGAEIFD